MSEEGFPKWAFESYPGAEQDFTDWLRQAARETIFSEIIEITRGDNSASAQANAMVEHWVMSRTKELTKTTERAFIYQLWLANSTGWYHNLPGELETIEELLSTLVDGAEEGTSKYYDFKFIVEHVMPVLRQAGAEPEDVWGLPNALSKSRVAVPLLREIISKTPEDELMPQEDVDEIVEICKDISNPDISFRAFREEISEKRGKSRTILSSIPMIKYHMPDGMEWLLVQSPSRLHTQTIEFATKGVINSVVIRDPWDLIRQVYGLLGKSIDNSPEISEIFQSILELADK